MCGVSAFVELKRDGSFNPALQEKKLETQLEESMDYINHRGPDARGRWFGDDHEVGMGHVRLKIIDMTEAGTQPFYDEDSDIHASVNGELYDWEQYREKLSNTHTFKSTCDCEILIALYKQYGLSFLSHLRGEFAFVLWDAKRKLFLAARDRYGIKPLYYTVVSGRLLVATEQKCFLAYGWRPEWDVRTLRDQSWRVESKTYFRGVHRIVPGHYMIVRNGEIEGQKPYWDHDYPNKFTRELRTEEDMVEGVRDRIIDAVRVRLRADVPVGVCLSGGLDSSTVAGVTAHLIKEGTKLGSDSDPTPSSMKCFTVQYDETSGLDESPIAQRTAEHLGVDFHRVKVDETSLASRFEDAVWHSEIPLPDVCGMARMALAEAVHASGIKVVVTGEGADESFGGYSSFRVDLLSEPDYSWPASDFPQAEREKALAKATKDAAKGEFGERSTNIPESIKRQLKNIATAGPMERVGDLPFSKWTDCYEPELPEARMLEGLNGIVREAMAKKWHPFHTGEYLSTKLFMAHFILRFNGDNFDMVSQVESRCPLLDHHVTEYVNNLPPSLKMKYLPVEKEWREKHILREAAKPFITEEVYNGVKKAFLGPRRYLAGGPMHQVFARLVKKENVESLGFVDWALVQDAMDKAFSTDDSAAFRRVFSVAQFIVLGKRFGVKTAAPYAN